MTREAEVDRSELVRKRYPLFADTARVVADPLVRNLATIGGNIAHADPANDHPATMLAYGAQVVATGPKGERTLPIADFFRGAFETALAQGEILTEIRIPRAQPRSGGAYFKLERKVGDYATAAVAVQVALDGSGKVASAGIGLTNVGLTPIFAKAASSSLEGKKPDEGVVAAAAKLASEAAEPVEDYRGSEEYKRHLVRTLTSRALGQALTRAEAMLSTLALSDEKRRRLKFPAGLDIGATTAEEIALSILAEMVQKRRSHPRAAATSLPLAPAAAVAKDPICGMTVDVATARHVLERDGVKFYFCCAGCKEKFAHAV